MTVTVASHFARIEKFLQRTLKKLTEHVPVSVSPLHKTTNPILTLFQLGFTAILPFETIKKIPHDKFKEV